MRFLDAIVCISLAARIHGTDKGVADTAKRCAKFLPRADRTMMFNIMNSKSPHLYVHTYLELMPPELLQPREEPAEVD